jgi:hypothetical protein
MKASTLLLVLVSVRSFAPNPSHFTVQLGRQNKKRLSAAPIGDSPFHPVDEYIADNKDALLVEATKAKHVLSDQFLEKICLPLIMRIIDLSWDAISECVASIKESGLESSIEESGTSDLYDSKDAAEASMDACEFMKALVTRAADAAGKKGERVGVEMWKELELVVYPEVGGKKFYDGEQRTKEQLLDDLDTDWEGSNDTIKKVKLLFSEKTLTIFEKDFSQKTIDDIFNEQRLSELEAMLKANVLPLKVEEDLDELKIIESTEDFVSFTPSDAGSYFANRPVEPDKAFAVVVAGESGSGKSVFSCLQTKSNGYTTVYCVVTEIDLGEKPKEADFPLLNELLRLVAKAVTDSKYTVPTIFYHEKQKLNRSRNEWAQGVLESALMRRYGTSLGRDWLLGAYSQEERPRSVAIILDEATDIDLVEGLLANIRTVRIAYRERLARANVLIVLTGTGLDMIRETGCVGSDPANSRLVILKSPEIETLVEKGHISKTVSEAIERGIFSRVMKTNARMFFRAVLPILNMKMHKEDESGLPINVRTDRLGARLEALASVKDLMDYAVRMYVQFNSVGRLSRADRVALLQRAFVYHWVTKMENAETKNLKINHILKKELAYVKTWDAWKEQEAAPLKIFERGLVSKSGTSRALKYLSCFGQTCTLRPGFGSDFEELVALHYLRLMEVQGFTTKRHILRHGWPPAWSGIDNATIDEAEITKLRDKLLKQAEEEKGNLKRCLTDLGDKACVVFSQGTATAQGGDVLALVVSNGTYRVDSIQCKNYASLPVPAKLQLWWLSLGINMNENNEWDLEPTAGSAGYSYAGLKFFCELLGNQLGGIPVDIGQRVIATSLKVPPRAKFPIPTEKDGTPIVNVSVWFREMLEPTISVLLSVNDEAETLEGS